MDYNGGPYFSFTQGFSLFVDCEDQAEVDAYWNALVNAGATPLRCSWITDQFGVTWQIVPRRFMELIRDQNPKKVQAAMDAMMTMQRERSELPLCLPAPWPPPVPTAPTSSSPRSPTATM